MTNHVHNRKIIIDQIKQELFGPYQGGKELDTNEEIIFSSYKEAAGPWKEKGTNQEILDLDSPAKRYGVGILFPYAVKVDDEDLDNVPGEDSKGLRGLDDKTQVISQKDLKKLSDSISNITRINKNVFEERTPKSYELSLSNTFRPSSMGVSFLSKIRKNSKIKIIGEMARYKKFPVSINGKSYEWWIRKPISYHIEYTIKEGIKNKITREEIELENILNLEGLKVGFEIIIRKYKKDEMLFTIALVNRTEGEKFEDDKCLFQVEFQIEVHSEGTDCNIVPYPETPIENLDDEEKSNELLYRNYPTYAIGHGCSADWEKCDDSSFGKSVKAVALPYFEIPSITADIEDDDGNSLKVGMAELAGLIDGEQNNLSSAIKLIEQYEKWIDSQENDTSKLNDFYKSVAKKHLKICREGVKRMREGIDFLNHDPQAMEAFKLANHAILLQQIRPEQIRRAEWDEENIRLIFSPEFIEQNPLEPRDDKGYWRAFQIAFILMTIKSSIDEVDIDRETVELIWFPSGGGKTEAYLGLAAFTIFFRRLKQKDDFGVQVLMRYTLRLLTTQQFIRASRLICSMEMLRRENKKQLGDIPFSIGLWVGSANSPNTRAEAISIFNSFSKIKDRAENKFVIDRCPWCSAEIGDNLVGLKYFKDAPRAIGYKKREGTIIIFCPDKKCQFHKNLPVYVIDEDVYDYCPSIVIGTVDKFATLAWRPQARRIFGLDEGGNRFSSPPGLIIQDELHLISGPLGSMVGLYEVVIEELCTDRRMKNRIKPKIITSTATTRRYRNQIKDLYGRNRVILFPPPGLNVDDSFFARYAKEKDGTLKPGKIYIGVNGPAMGSLQTAQVRTYSAILQAPMVFETEEERDPWWTLMLFFNSLRELGTTLSLLQSYIPYYFGVIKKRFNYKTLRSFWKIKELTGRASSGDIRRAIGDLEITCNNQQSRSIDVCLASNVLEVGIDIDRLSIMSITSQPKSTSQYIQVTGRVGRKWEDKPGLIVTIYSPTRPRDRSHYERFRSYHEKLYAQVEPTSVTPFSAPALERALHAVMVIYVRQKAELKYAKQSPQPFPGKLIEELKRILIPRIMEIDPNEVDNFNNVFDKRMKQWKNFNNVIWSGNWKTEDVPLLTPAGGYVPPENIGISWETPLSMRSVDAECLVEIAHPSLLMEEEDA